MKYYFFTAALALSYTLYAGCAGKKQADPAPTPLAQENLQEAASYERYLSRFRWKLIRVREQPVPKEGLFLLFNKDAKICKGRSLSNEFAARYTITKEYIILNNLEFHRPRAGNNEPPLEKAYLDIINQSDTLRYDIADQVLNIYKNDEIVLMYIKVSDQ